MSRKEKIYKAVLDVLNDHEENAVLDTIVHAEINLRVTPNALLSEFDEAIQAGTSARHIVSVRAKFSAKNIKLSITDEGRAARLQMT